MQYPLLPAMNSAVPRQVPSAILSAVPRLVPFTVFPAVPYAVPSMRAAILSADFSVKHTAVSRQAPSAILSAAQYSLQYPLFFLQYSHQCSLQ